MMQELIGESTWFESMATTFSHVENQAISLWHGLFQMILQHTPKVGMSSTHYDKKWIR